MSSNYKIENLLFKYLGYGFDFKIDQLNLDQGNLICIIGPNGSGKSTFLNLCSGGEKNYSGKIILSGKDIRDFKNQELALKVSFLPQYFEKGEGYTSEDVVMMGRYPHQKRSFFPSLKDRDAVFAAFEKAGAEDFMKRDFSSLSGGEKKRVLIASVLAQETDFLLLDEPTSSLDIKGQWEIFSILKEIRKENKGIIVATHNINLASIYGDEIILFSKGRILEKGKPDHVITKENLEKAYGSHIEIIEHPLNKKRRIVLPGIKGEYI